jgi:predicted ATPase
MIRGVIIEGLSTAGKTSVFAALKTRHSQAPEVEKTIIAIRGHYSQRGFM